MQVTFYGVRGSIATPGPATVRYGGNTVCIGLRTMDGTCIVLDGGTGMRVLGDELVRQPLPDKIHVLVTHGHWDHIMGVPFFAPLWRPDATVVLHSLSPRSERLTSKAVLFDGEHFPVRLQDIPSRLERPPFASSEIRIGSATVRAIALNHPGGADGFRIDDADGSSICYLTDNELSPPSSQAMASTRDDLARFSAGTGLLIHDAQYLPSDMPHKRGWGHSLVDEVLELGRLAEARALALHHHDPSRDDAALDAVAERARAWGRQHAPAMNCLVGYEGLRLEIVAG